MGARASHRTSAHLTVTCLCGCRQVKTYQSVNLTLEHVLTEVDVVDAEDNWFASHPEFDHYKVRFSQPIHCHDTWAARHKVRGVMQGVVFALPCIEWHKGEGWRTRPDADGNHFAIKSVGA